MSKRRKVPSSQPAEGRPHAERSSSDPPGATAFRFLRFFVADLEFRELPLREPAPSTDGLHVDVELGVMVGLSASGQEAEIRLTATVKPDPHRKPYLIKATVVGQFGSRGASREQLEAFVQQQGPVILFPYLRQVIDKTTIDGRYGLVRLDLMNLHALFANQQWESSDPSEARPAEPGKAITK